MAQANKYQIKSIAVNEFAIVAPSDQVKQGQGFNFDIQFKHTVAIEQNLVNVITTVSVFGSDKNKIFSRLQTICSYQINEPEFASQDKEGNLKLNDAVAQDLNTISLSTTRGMLYSQLKGTYLHNAILPVVDLNATKK